MEAGSDHKSVDGYPNGSTQRPDTCWRCQVFGPSYNGASCLLNTVYVLLTSRQTRYRPEWDAQNRRHIGELIVDSMEKE